jgi:hypothetical protein
MRFCVALTIPQFILSSYTLKSRFNNHKTNAESIRIPLYSNSDGMLEPMIKISK